MISKLEIRAINIFGSAMVGIILTLNIIVWDAAYTLLSILFLMFCLVFVIMLTKDRAHKNLKQEVK